MEIENKNILQIDLESIIKGKSENFARKIPKFVIYLATKIICVKQINIILAKFGHLRGIDFVKAMFDELKLVREFKGLEQLPEGRKYIFASNHPLGGLDGLVLVEGVESRFKGTKVLVNDLLMNLTPLTPFFLPINKHGKQNPEYVKLLADHMECGAPLIYFPAGLCSRLFNGKVTDVAWKKNFVQKAIEGKRDIVPTYVMERNSNTFYVIYVIRRLLRIKTGIEMILLPSEVFKKARRKGRIRIIFGEPISYEELINSKLTPTQWTAEIRSRSYALKNEYINQK